MFKIFNKGSKKKLVEAVKEEQTERITENKSSYKNEIFALVSQVKKNIDILVKEEGNITYGLDEILKGAEVTTDKTNRVNEHLQKLTKNSDNTKQLVENVFVSLDKSNKEIKTAKKDFAEVTNQVGSVSVVFDEFRKLIVEIQTHYNSIQGFASIITGIAEQTNLLSLNAAIEAARVGESGKGFTVVANEIKKLSVDTQDNAKDIMNSLKNLTESMKKLASKSNDGASVVNKSTEIIQTSATILDRIVDAEAEVHKDLQEVKASQIENLEGIKEISSNLEELVEKSKSENQELEEIILSIQKKADSYMNILNYLNQIKILKDQSKS